MQDDLASTGLTYSLAVRAGLLSGGKWLDKKGRKEFQRLLPFFSDTLADKWVLRGVGLLRILIFAFVAVAGFAQVTTARAAARFLDQATWGPTPASIAQVQALGIPDWLAAQFALNTSDLPDQPILNAAGKPNGQLAPVEQAFFSNAVMGADQLRQRVAFVLSQIWVVSATSGVNHAYAFPPYWRIFRDNAFGNYRDIIKTVTLSPAMGRYLDMANNKKGDPAKNTAANENYARELMQLFTLGLDAVESGWKRAGMRPTYDQSVVTNMAKALTGWTYPTAPERERGGPILPYYFGQMFAVEAEHDTSREDDFREHHDSGRADRGAGSGIRAGCADGAADHGSIRVPATD